MTSSDTYRITMKSQKEKRGSQPASAPNVVTNSFAIRPRRPSLCFSSFSATLFHLYLLHGTVVVKMHRRRGARGLSMPAARFCSECGARFKVKRTSILPVRSFCSECSPRVRQIRLILIVVPVLCAVVGFAIGRYTSVPEPFYFIGTPVDLNADPVAALSNSKGNHSSGGNATLSQPDQLAAPQSAEGVICGAQTKSGRPCRRRVKGGGHCWQHRAAATTTK